MYAVSSLRRWKRAGLLTELRPAEAQHLLPKSANTQGPPSPSVLHAYYAGNGDPVEALWRRQADHFVELTTRATPERVCQALEHALPCVGPLSVRVTAPALFVHAGQDVATVSRVVRHARVRARKIRHAAGGPLHIVRAVNAILARRDYGHRFIELAAAPGCHMFVAVDASQARTLQEWGATKHGDLGSLWTFAGWNRATRSRAAG